MIDIENYVYTQVRGAVLDSYNNVDISSEYVENPAKFPHICLEMTDSAVSARYMTAQDREFATEQAFSVNIFTNTPTAKTDAKKLAEIVDGVMQGLGFRRTLYLRTPNVDRTIYRLTLRYTGIVSLGYDKAQGQYKISAR